MLDYQPWTTLISSSDQTISSACFTAATGLEVLSPQDQLSSLGHGIEASVGWLSPNIWDGEDMVPALGNSNRCHHCGSQVY
jgi:hypothetical protein